MVEDKKEENGMISAWLSLAIFGVATLVFFFARYYAVDRHINGSATTRMVLSILYFLIVIGIQLVANIKNTAILCNGSPQTNTAIIYTLLPNFFIFGTIIILLNILPGWKAPFSNTIGYGLVWLRGVSDAFSDILAPAKNTSGSKLIDKICQDHSIVINELTPTNFFAFLGRMAKDGLLVKGWKNSPAMFRLWEDLAIKNLFAEMIWYGLTGALVISTTYNSLLDITCDISSSQRDSAMAKFEQERATLDKRDPKYFTVHD